MGFLTGRRTLALDICPPLLQRYPFFGHLRILHRRLRKTVVDVQPWRQKPVLDHILLRRKAPDVGLGQVERIDLFSCGYNGYELRLGWRCRGRSRLPSDLSTTRPLRAGYLPTSNEEAPRLLADKAPICASHGSKRPTRGEARPGEEARGNQNCAGATSRTIVPWRSTVSGTNGPTLRKSSSLLYWFVLRMVVMVRSSVLSWERRVWPSRCRPGRTSEDRFPGQSPCVWQPADSCGTARAGHSLCARCAWLASCENRDFLHNAHAIARSPHTVNQMHWWLPTCCSGTRATDQPNIKWVADTTYMWTRDRVIIRGGGA